MSPRGRRGAAAALLASRMTEEIDIDEDEREEIDGLDAGADDPEPEIEDDGADDEIAPDYSHIEEEPDPEPEAPTDALDDLQRQLAELRGQNETLSKQAERGEAAELAADQAHVVAALNAAKSDLASARSDYEAAAAAGKWSVAAAAQEKMSLAAADLRECEGALDDVKGAIARFNKGERRAQPATTPTAVPADQFEAAIANMGEKSKEWCRKNKADLQKSPARGQRAVTAHLEALDAGHKVDTPEYFQFLDKQMGYETVTTTTRKPKPTGQARVAAPGGSRSAPPRGGSITEVKLSKAEVDTARALGMTTKEYAANKRELIQNGKDATRSGPRYSDQTHANRR